jgi:hypothetical protein
VDGVVYIGSNDNNLYALNATTGALRWSYATGNEVQSLPAVVNGVVYVGGFDNSVYALNASTGALIWRYTSGGRVYSSSAVTNGVVYIGSADDNFYALQATTGARLWIHKLYNFPDSGLSAANGVVYVTANTGKTSALNAKTGALLWSYQTIFPISRSGVCHATALIDYPMVKFPASGLSTGKEMCPWMKVKSSFAMHSACDRQIFALGPVPSRTSRRRFREKGWGEALRCQKSPFSSVRFVELKSQKTGISREFPENSRHEFSAVQTVWRRARHSNPRYRSFRCKGLTFASVTPDRSSQRILLTVRWPASPCGPKPSWSEARGET